MNTPSYYLKSCEHFFAFVFLCETKSKSWQIFLLISKSLNFIQTCFFIIAWYKSGRERKAQKYKNKQYGNIPGWCKCEWVKFL